MEILFKAAIDLIQKSFSLDCNQIFNGRRFYEKIPQALDYK